MNVHKPCLHFICSEFSRRSGILLLETAVLIVAAIYYFDHQTSVNYGPCNQYSIAIAAVFAVIFGFHGFYWLLSVGGSEFYFSVPLKRRTIFLVNYLSGAACFLLPFAVYQGICGVILYSQGVCGSGRILQYFFWGNLTALAGFLVIYHLTIAVCLFCGIPSAAISTFLILFFYSQIWVAGVIKPLCSLFFHNYYSIPFWDSVREYGNPYLFFQKTAGLLTDQNPVFNPYEPQQAPLIGCGIFLAATFVLLYYLFKNRASETAGRPFDRKSIQAALKVALLTPLTLLIARFFLAIWQGNPAAGLAGIVIGLLLGCCLFQLLFGLPFRGILKAWKSAAVSTVISGCLLAGFWGFAGRYDLYIPPADTVNQTAVAVGGIDEPVAYAGSSTFIERRLQSAKLSGAASDTARSWLAGLDKKHQAGETPLTFVWAAFYRENAPTIYRKYPIFTEQEVDRFQEVYATKEYKAALYPAAGMKEMDTTQWTIYWSNAAQTLLLDLGESEKKALLEIYEKELTRLSLSALRHNTPIGKIVLVNEPTQITTTAYLYPDFSETISFLEKRGVPVQNNISDYQITKATVITFNEQGYPTQRKALTKEQIEIIKSSLLSADFYINPLLYPLDTTKSYEILLRPSQSQAAIKLNCYLKSNEIIDKLRKNGNNVFE